MSKSILNCNSPINYQCFIRLQRSEIPNSELVIMAMGQGDFALAFVNMESPKCCSIFLSIFYFTSLFGLSSENGEFLRNKFSGKELVVLANQVSNYFYYSIFEKNLKTLDELKITLEKDTTLSITFMVTF